MKTINSESNENFFAAVYRLTCGSTYATTTDIACSLGVSLPTISEKIVKFADQGYLDHKWRKGVALTREGRILSLRVIRRHRLIETFLTEILKIPVEEVNTEACRLEHAVSELVLDAMDVLLGFPDVDPHGHPIPGKNGEIKELEYKTLADALPGWNVVVKQVSDRDREQFHYLSNLGILPGVKISILGVSPFDGPMDLLIEENKTVLGRGIARKVGIKELPEPRDGNT